MSEPIDDKLQQERQRCLGLAKMIPWWDPDDHTRRAIGEVYQGMVENGVHLDKAWMVKYGGTTVYMHSTVQVCRIYHPHDPCHHGDDVLIGLMVQDMDDETWVAVVYKPDGSFNKADKQTDFPGPYEASAWVAECWDNLVLAKETS